MIYIYIYIYNYTYIYGCFWKWGIPKSFKSDHIWVNDITDQVYTAIWSDSSDVTRWGPYISSRWDIQIWDMVIQILQNLGVYTPFFQQVVTIISDEYINPSFEHCTYICTYSISFFLEFLLKRVPMGWYRTIQYDALKYTAVHYNSL